jgi:hypothetical protein
VKKDSYLGVKNSMNNFEDAYYRKINEIEKLMDFGIIQEGKVAVGYIVPQRPIIRHGFILKNKLELKFNCFGNYGLKSIIINNNYYIYIQCS